MSAVTQGTSLASAWSETGLTVVPLDEPIIRLTSCLRISSAATSAARLGLDCESREMISTGYFFLPIMMPSPIAARASASTNRSASPNAASGPDCGLTNPIFTALAAWMAGAGKLDAAAAASTPPAVFEGAPAIDLVSLFAHGHFGLPVFCAGTVRSPAIGWVQMISVLGSRPSSTRP